MRSRLVYIGILILSFCQIKAQEVQKYLIKGSVNFDVAAIESGISTIIGNRSDQLKLKPVFKSAQLYSLDIYVDDFVKIDAYLSDLPGVLWMEQDIPISKRNTPDDAFYDRQWYLDKIQAVNSWNITQGGLSPNGDTIVIAVLDDGFFTDHTDLNANLWRNRGEIPGDGIDNDDNGYKDDFLGINIKSGNDLHVVNKHGTEVAGVIGASGNNAVGTSGVNWNVKLLLISDATTLSNVIEAYQYVLDTRKKYNETNGAEGAYIVVTNLSAGIDKSFPEDHPLFQEWCNVYDALGEAGVLNVNATTNSNTNIDVEGDMPGSCASEFLIIVTNSDKNDNKVIDAGYGVNFVDLAAPGVEIFTTSLDNNYEFFSGASSSSPQVSGAIGLLYAAPCQNFADLVQSNPEAGAMQMKSMILSGVDSFTPLQGIMKSGGRLNIQRSMDELRNFCGGSTGELGITKIIPNPVVNGKFSVEFESENFEAHEFEIRNLLGQLMYSSSIYPSYFGDKIFDVELIPGAIPYGVYVATLRSGSKISSIKLLMW